MTDFVLSNIQPTKHFSDRSVGSSIYRISIPLGFVVKEQGRIQELEFQNFRGSGVQGLSESVPGGCDSHEVKSRQPMKFSRVKYKACRDPALIIHQGNVC